MDNETQMLGEIKNSGRSSDEEEHRLTDSKSLIRGMRSSGPSHGEGHKFTDTRIGGGMKLSGPSLSRGGGRYLASVFSHFCLYDIYIDK